MIDSVGMLRKGLQYRGFFEKSDAENLQDFAEAAGEGESFLDDGQQHVHADRNPDLGLHRVDRRTVECLDAQVVLDPLEEQLDLPAALVKLRDGQGRQSEVVGQEDET